MRSFGMLNSQPPSVLVATGLTLLAEDRGIGEEEMKAKVSETGTLVFVQEEEERG